MKKTIRILLVPDIPILAKAFANWPKTEQLFINYHDEQLQGQRIVWVAFQEQEILGYITLKWVSEYPYFRENNIPEINDLNVLPEWRKQGIGLALLKTAESKALEKSDMVGLGVGLYPDYGAAQKLYVKNGYIPDGNGVTYKNQYVAPGNSVVVDDELILWFTKQLR